MTLDELNFKLLIDDSQFNTQVAKAIAEAEKLNTSLSQMLSIMTAARIVSPEDLANMEKLNKLLRDNANVEQKISSTKTKRLKWEQVAMAELAEVQKQAAKGIAFSSNSANEQSKTINNMRQAQEGFNKEVTKSSKLWMQLKNLTTAYFSVMGVSRLVSNLIRISAEFEKQRISLETILRDINGADRIFEQIKSLAVMSPFTFKELVTYTKQLSAFSVPMNELYDTTKMLADVSAGLGVGMDRLILAYGQIRSASFLRGQEVRQLTEAGVPILKELSKQLTEIEGKYVSVGEVFDKISARQVTFEMVEKVFKDMTSEGGKFYQMQEVLASTLSGKISNLKDAYQIMFAEIGQKNNGILVKSVDALRSMAEHYEDIGKRITELVVAYGAYRGMLMALNAATGVADKGLLKMASSLTKVTSFLAANPWVAFAAAITAAGYALYRNATRLSESDKLIRSITKSSQEYTTEVNTEIAKLDALKAKIDLAKEGTEEYDNAKRALMSKYSDYINELEQEGVAVDNLATLYANLKTKIEEATKSRFMESATADLDKVFGESMDKYYADFQDIVEKYQKETNREMNALEKEALWQYLSSQLTMWDLQADARLANVAGMLTNANLSSGYDAKKLRNDMQLTTYTYQQGVKDITDAYFVLQKATNDSTVELRDWQNQILDIKKEAKENGVMLNLKVDETTTLETIVDTVKERIEEIEKDIALNEGIQDDTAEALKRQLAYYQKINREVLLGKATAKGTGSSGGDTRVKQIQDQIEAYRTLKSVYEDFLEYMDETSARTALGDFYGDIFGDKTDADFDKAIAKLKEELVGLGEEGAKAAASLSEGFAKEAVQKYLKDLKKAEDATEKFNSMMADMGEFFSLGGKEGLDLDVQKIVNDYRKTLGQIAKAKADSINTLNEYARETGIEGTAEYNDSLQQINEYYANETENALTEASDKAKDAIKKFYEAIRDKDFDISNLSDKTINQLRQMKEGIANISTEGMSQETIDNFDTLGIAIDAIVAEFEELKDTDLGKIFGEVDEKKVRMWKGIADNILKVADALAALGEETGNQQLVDFANFANGLADVVKSAAAGFASGGPIGAVVGGASALAVKLLEAATNAEKVKNEIKEIATQKYLDDLAAKIDAASTLFGDSWLGQIRAIRSAINELQREMAELGRQDGGKTFLGYYHAVLNNKLSGYAKELGMEMYEAEGVFSSYFLDAVDAAFQKDLKSNKLYDEFSELKQYNERLKELYKDLDDAIGTMFSNLGESITDELIDKLWQTGEAVTDLEGTFQDLGNTIMKSLINSFVIDEILAKYKEQVKSWWTADMSADEIASQMEDFATNVRGDIEKANDIIVGIFNAFASRDLISNGEASENTLANGIKGITEETASLLASYVNAIRADVAAGRLQWEDMATNIRLMVGMLPQTPTLAEYLTQIQANTFNTAERTREIMERLELITTSEGGAAAFRVFM